MNRSPTVLVIDDDISVLGLVIENLESIGYVGLGASTAEATLELIDRYPSVQVLIADIDLNPGSGPQLVRHVLQKRHLKVVFMSERPFRLTFRRSDPVLVKPVQIAPLRRALEAIFTEQPSLPKSEYRLFERRRRN
jgi:DNA-binding NtrC family response regulator